MQTAIRNPFEEAARERKRLRLVMAIDAAFDLWGIDPFSALALAIVRGMNAKAWAQALRSAGIEKASETTRGLVVEVYRARAEMRAALARVA